MNPALHSSERMDWQTPDVVLDCVRELAPIGLDPCTVQENPTGADAFFTPAEDGLSHGWRDSGLVYVNPPYGRELPQWVDKCVEEAGLYGWDCEIVLLVPARPDTRWWSVAMTTAKAVAFWRGRLRFRGAPYPAPFPSALFYWGGSKYRFARAFKSKCEVHYSGEWTKVGVP